MHISYTEWLAEATKKYLSCAYACKRGIAGGCALDAYPILDCPKCKSYKKRAVKDES